MSNSSTAKKKRGFARIEFLAVQPDAKKLLEAGHTFQSAYDELFGSGKITMSYPMFAKYARKGVTPILTQRACGVKRKKTEDQAATQPDTSTSVPQQQEAAQEKVLGVVETNSFKKSSSNKKDLI